MATTLFDQFAQAAAEQGRTLRNRFGRPFARRRWTRQVIKTTQWDDFDWQGVRKTKEINAAITDLFMGDLKNPDERPGYLNAPELVRDIFMTFLKPVPMMHDPREVIRDALLNGKFIRQLMALTDWERLHDQTATDVMLSQMATTIVMDALKEMIAAHREQVKQSNEERQSGEDPFQGKMPPTNGGDPWDEESGRGRGKASSEAGGEGNAQGGQSGHTDGTGESQTHKDQDEEDGQGEEEQPVPAPPPWDSEEDMRESIRQELEEQQGQGQGAGQEQEAEGQEAEAETEEAEAGAGGDGEEDADGNIDEEERDFDANDLDAEWEEESDWEQMLEGVDFGRSVRQALEQAAEQIGDLEESRRGVGLSDADWKMMDPKERLKIAEKLNTPRMRAIANMVGRMKRFALSKQATKVIDAPHEIFDVEMGKDLRRVLRTEFAFLGHPDTKPLFYRKFIDGELLQYKERGHEQVGKGPMIVCVDDLTEIMTASGWKRYSAVEVGDLALTLNHKTGLSEWQPITKVHVLPDEERTMLQMQGKRHDSLTTLDHRWPVLASHGRTGGKRRPYQREWKMSQELTTEDRLVTAAVNAQLPTQAKYSDSLVELVAWTWTDGSAGLGATQQPLVRIYQSHRVYPLFTERIRAALIETFGPESAGDLRTMRDGTPRWRSMVDETAGSTVFSLNSRASEEILEHMDTDRVVDRNFILSLTEDQLALFYATSIFGDGSTSRVPYFGQAEAARREVFELACALAGVQTNSGDDSVRLMSKQHLSLSGLKRRRVQHQGIVWCVTVENSSWLARRNGKVYYTGNCIDNSGSMGGTPENWAKGVAEAMRRICADQGRDFHAIYFETNYHRERFDFPGGHGPFEKVLAFLSVSAGGGTEFDGVLTEALGKCKNMFEAEGKGKADIVFITDGESRLDEKWIKNFIAERDEIGARIFGIYISAYDSTRSSACRLLERFCHTVTPVKALEVNDDATDFLFATL